MPTLETAPASAVSFIKQSRVIRAPRSKVYEAWIKPEIMQQWFCPGERHCPLATLDVREGGAYRIEIHVNPGAELPPQMSVAEGVYTEIVPNEKLQFTWKASWNPGADSLVTVTFADAPGGTEVTILHERISGDGSQGYSQGWANCLEKLGVVLEA